MTSQNGAAFTNYGWAVCLWALVVPFQHGFHIAALNQIQAALTCKAPVPSNVSTLTGPLPFLAPCIPMTDTVFSLVTAIFTVGGLLGSLIGNAALDKLGRRDTNRVCAVGIVVGSAFMGLSSSPAGLMIGRFIIGFGCGLGLCVGPVFLSEIAPSAISGNVGVLTQLSIVIGIMISQVAGILLAAPSTWRYVFLLPFTLCAVQFLLSSFIVESPYYLLRKNRLEEHKTAGIRLWGDSAPTLVTDSAESGPLLEELDTLPRYVDADAPREDREREEISTLEAFRMKELRRPLLIVSLGMMAQQLSGMNAVLYYSNEILSKSLPELGAYVSLGVTVINVLMTFPPILFIEKIGRKPLLVVSSAGAFVSTVVLGYALDTDAPSASTWSTIAIIVFVMSFALGLGPVPFVMIPEVGPAYAVSALSSVAFSVSWVANFVVGVAFLPLRNALAHGDSHKEGLVFYISVVVFAIPAFFLLRLYKPEHKGNHINSS